MSDLPALITALVGALTLFGGGIGFVWNKVNTLMTECKARDMAHGAQIDRLRFLVQRNNSVVMILLDEVHRTNPSSPSLQTVAKILRQTFPVDEETPDELADLLARIERKAA